MPRPSNTSSWSPHHVAHWRFLLGATLVVFHAVFAQPLLQQRMLEAARQRKIARFERKRGSRVFTDIGRKAIAQVRNEARAMLEGRLSMEKADELAKKLLEGTWTRDYPISAAEAKAIGLNVSTNIPTQILDFRICNPPRARGRVSAGPATAPGARRRSRVVQDSREDMQMVFAPFLFIYVFICLAFLGGLLILIQLQLISSAFVILGLSPRVALLVLLVSLIGSYINIPLYTVESGAVPAAVTINNFGVVYTIPFEYGVSRTTVAVNVGGALVPMFICAYALLRAPAAFLPSVIGTAIVAVVAHLFAQPVRGLGIAIPVFIPPLAAVLVVCNSDIGIALMYHEACLTASFD
jgi:uncharacterized membrane protein